MSYVSEWMFFFYVILCFGYDYISVANFELCIVVMGDTTHILLNES